MNAGYRTGVKPQSAHQFRIALVGPSRFGIGQPFAGGLEAHTALLARSLHSRHHAVQVFAGAADDSDAVDADVVPIIEQSYDHDRDVRRDLSPPESFRVHETERYEQIAEHLELRLRADLDVVHNNSLHPAIVDGDRGDGSHVHLLHCPPFDELQAAHQRLAQRSERRRVVAVSNAVADAWNGLATDVVHNGVDVDSWAPPLNCARSGLAWAGRIVEEKAPHLAIRAARLCGLAITLAGPVGDQRYFDRFVERELGPGVEWRGPLTTAELARVFHTAAVGVVTPAWNEPFCLVAAEMLAAGLPVAAFERGGLTEFVDRNVGTLATPNDAASLAAAIRRSIRLDSAHCVEHARNSLRSETMIARYESFYAQCAGRRPWNVGPLQRGDQLSA